MSADNVVKLSPTATGATPRGWHGMTARPHRRYRPDDYAAWNEIGNDADACLVDTVRDSPAWLGDIKSGTWVISINGMGFDAFERSSPAVGAVIEVRAFAAGLGSFSRRIVLIAPPEKDHSSGPRQRNRAPPAWKRERPVLPGKPVFKDARPCYLELAARHPFVRRHVWLLTTLLKMHWHRGITPRHTTIAKAAGCSTTAVKRSQACCQHFGFLKVTSGKRLHRHNRYEVTWPVGSE
jgi:hypothetical protein